MTGTSGDNTLDGGLGNDTLWGGAGNDILKGNTGTSDWVSYAGATAGVTVDLVKATKQVTVGAGDDTLTGFENVLGSGHDDNLKGSTVANIIDGGAGNDIMAGGTGNDTYYVDSADDVVTELNLAGTDKVISSIDYSLADTDGAGANGGNVENLTLTGSADIDGTGTAVANILIGNDGREHPDRRLVATTRLTAASVPTRWSAARATTTTRSTTRSMSSPKSRAKEPTRSPARCRMT